MLIDDPSKKGLKPLGEQGYELAEEGSSVVKDRDLSNTDGTLPQEQKQKATGMLLVYAAFFMYSFTTYGGVPNMNLLLTSEGISLEAAALAASLFGVCLMCGKVLYGTAVDRIGFTKATVGGYALYIAGMFLLPAGLGLGSILPVLTAAMLFGSTSGKRFLLLLRQVLSLCCAH